jgi:adenine-specific DNA glycosylase
VSGESVRSTGFEPDNGKIDAVRKMLISWFEENGRDLPWRRTRDPWLILVSEVMLQQIQVKRAVPFYEAFVGRFATPRALAEAPLAEAIRVWGNLGRYRRVVNLHRTARILIEEFGGEVPSDPVVQMRLPGIGGRASSSVGLVVRTNLGPDGVLTTTCACQRPPLCHIHEMRFSASSFPPHGSPCPAY